MSLRDDIEKLRNDLRVDMRTHAKRARDADKRKCDRVAEVADAFAIMLNFVISRLNDILEDDTT